MYFITDSTGQTVWGVILVVTSIIGFIFPPLDFLLWERLNMRPGKNLYYYIFFGIRKILSEPFKQYTIDARRLLYCNLHILGSIGK